MRILLARAVALLLFAALSGETAIGRPFLPSVRVDHENRTDHWCFHASITLGPRQGGSEPVYVAFQNDSVVGIVTVRSDVYFQKSNDNGQTWLSEDLLIKKGQAFACYPDITTAPDGSIYIVYTERLPGGSNGHFYCVRSTDAGETWSQPAQVDDNSTAVSSGWARIAVDTLGGLFCAWNDRRTGRQAIWSAASTDSGQTWSANVKVFIDTVPSDFFHADVAVNPGTNDYLCVASIPFWIRSGYIGKHSAFARSTDRGASFLAEVVLDTFTYYSGQPHVVADREYVIADYTGNTSGNQQHTQVRTSANCGDTWGPVVPVTNLDTTHSSYYNGAKLALDAGGGVHTALMLCPLSTYDYDVWYARSTDHGLTWPDRVLVNDVTTSGQVDPDIAADSAGFAYAVWQDQRNSRNEIWSATNSGVGIAGPGGEPLARLSCTPSVFRDLLTIRLSSPQAGQNRVSVFDPAGRLVRTLTPTSGERSLAWNGRSETGRECPPGIYLLRDSDSPASTSLKVLKVN